MAKRNKKSAQKMTTEGKEVMPGSVAPTTEETIVNADEMAKAVSTSSGNDYQQYIRNLFKAKLQK